MLLLYMCLIVENILGGVPYFTNIYMTSAWLDVSKGFKGFDNSTLVVRLGFFPRCDNVFIMNVPS